METKSVNEAIADSGLDEFDDDNDYLDNYESSDLIQDEDGFPSFHKEEEEEGFASDFYRCGSDWSSLLDTTKKLKQPNLFQIWGMKSKSESQVVNPSFSHPNKQPNLFQIWGIKSKSESQVVSSSSSPPNKKRKTAIPKSETSQMKNKINRPCPFYKKIPGTPFTVDAFRYGSVEGCLAYFLTHFHYDHYGGLTKGWSHGPIYCSPLTARLVKLSLSVNQSFIHPLELNTEHVIEGVKVTLLEANHCPGAALIHFRLRDGQCYLHTGDFRACKLMQTYPLLVNHRVNVLYLDTTYCNPKYKFPSKEDVLNYVVKVTKNHLKKQPRTLVVVGAYSIGKECVFLAIAKALGIKIHANASRRRILQSFDWPELSGSCLSTQGKDTLLHVLPISALRHETLIDYLKTYKNQYSGVLAFRPTGWTFSDKIGDQLDLIRPTSKGNITVYGVPYSEHSSFTEMQEFVQFLKPDKIIPTVNVGNAASREKMQSYFREWLKGT